MCAHARLHFSVCVWRTQARGVCGQALVQRAPGSGQPLFVHRVLAKYNLGNLLAGDSWQWLTAPRPAHGASGLVQKGWCMEAENAEEDAEEAKGNRRSSRNHNPPLKAGPEIAAVAMHVLKARMGMLDHF